MRYGWIDEYLLSKTGVTKDIQEDWNWIRYQIGGKMFAAICLSGESNEPYQLVLGGFSRKKQREILES